MLYSARSTAEWQELDRRHHVHPFNDIRALNRQGTRVINRGEGVYVWDTDNRKILDGMAGLWCVNAGYGCRELIEAAQQQLGELAYYNSFFQTATPPQIELARQLSEITPSGLDHFFYANSGSEANDTVVRLVRHFWKLQGKPGKKVFIGRTLGYHGSTLAATSLGGMAPMHAMGDSLLPGFEHIPHPHWYASGGDLDRDEFGLRCARYLEEKILELGAENVAAFIGEPIQGAGGVIDPPQTYWPEIQRICRRHDILLVADEVICGFGRTGHWFGSDTYDIQPDLMPMAKGLSSGYMPISAVAFNDRVFETLNGGGELPHGYTYSGHPVACSVSIANIELIRREGLVEKVREESGPYFRAGLEEIAANHPLVGEVRGAGLMAGLQLVRDKAAREFFPAEEKVAVRCRDYCMENGLILRAVGNSMVACPPLIIGREEIDELLAKTRDALDKTARDFGLL
ncbi:aspartate aminotransferase family protein [Microbulbifer litoralis]|uniref:aspartate aminotransferase family protein n=1 Tax=Microbulbifer litoralis TaxID=2933965 RepID=UPI0020298ADB|nr:aspartate aminotransferase family protein [Microbulbifer sp. GX H0434]